MTEEKQADERQRANVAKCPWCQTMVRGGYTPDKCTHLEPGMAEAAQETRERG